MVNEFKIAFAIVEFVVVFVVKFLSFFGFHDYSMKFATRAFDVAGVINVPTISG